MPRSQEYISIDCTIQKETDAAILIDVEGEDYWIPFSQIESVRRMKDGMAKDSVIMTAWIAKTKGLR